MLDAFASRLVATDDQVGDLVNHTLHGLEQASEAGAVEREVNSSLLWLENMGFLLRKQQAVCLEDGSLRQMHTLQPTPLALATSRSGVPF